MGSLQNWFVIVIILEKNISGSLAVQRSLHNACANRSGVRLPILPVHVYTSRDSKLVYALLDTASEETLISKRLYNELNLKWVHQMYCLLPQMVHEI